MRHIRLKIRYNGANYAGWQVQKKDITIQGTIEEALYRITGRRTRVTGAARTDAGVHALEQVAVIHTDSELPEETIKNALNAHLPEDIRIILADIVNEDFHPRYSARKKTYCYFISYKRPYSVFLKNYSWVYPVRLNIDAMQAASEYLRGKHDFSSFRASGCSAKNPIREVMRLDVEEKGITGFLGFEFNTPFITIRIQANAFLRHMARNIVGTLVDVGRGRIDPEEIRNILAARDRSRAGRTAPASGLFLEKIEY